MPAAPDSVLQFSTSNILPSDNQSQNLEIHFKVLRVLEERPVITQRELAQLLGVSLGKANYCLKALIDKGWIKANNFKNSNRKSSYAYLLTPTGIERKAQVTVRFLKRKLVEYETLRAEIEILQQELADQDQKPL